VRGGGGALEVGESGEGGLNPELGRATTALSIPARSASPDRNVLDGGGSRIV
jgi:hypothetical protein